MCKWLEFKRQTVKNVCKCCFGNNSTWKKGFLGIKLNFSINFTVNPVKFSTL